MSICQNIKSQTYQKNYIDFDSFRSSRALHTRSLANAQGSTEGVEGGAATIWRGRTSLVLLSFEKKPPGHIGRMGHNTRNYSKYMAINIKLSFLSVLNENYLLKSRRVWCMN